MARFFIATARAGPTSASSAPEVCDHFEEIRDPDGYTIPAGPADELTAILTALS